MPPRALNFASMRAPLPGAALLMGLSGFAGLGYQIVWTEQFAVWLGQDIVAVLAVVAAVFGGLGLGGYALARPIAASPRPARWYAGCEVVIGLWGLLLSGALPSANAALAALTGPQPSALWQWSVAFLGPFLLLLPATCAMGATLPAIERVVALRARRQRHSAANDAGDAIGGLYAANTFGAVLGVLATAFVLVPWLGLADTARVCVVMNLVSAAGVLLLARAQVGAGVGVGADAEPTLDCSAATAPATPLVAMAASAASRRALVTLAVTGALGMGYEVVVVRVLSQVAQDTVYTFALLLAAYLLGSAGGAAFYQRRLAGRNPSSYGADALRSQLISALALACLLGTATLWVSESLRAAVQQFALQALAGVGVGVAGAGAGAGAAFGNAAGTSIDTGIGAAFSAALAGEVAMALAAFALPTFAMGALFSHLCSQARSAGCGLGAAVGINTLGAALAPLVFGVLLVPVLGAKNVLLAIGAAYLLLLPLAQWRRLRTWGPALATGMVAVFAGELIFVDLPPGARLLSYRDGVMATVSVVEDAAGVSRLRINNRQQEGSSASGLSDARQAYLPLLLHPAPVNVLFLGLGTGLTAAAAAEDLSLKVDAVELLPEVIEASALFRADAALSGVAAATSAAAPAQAGIPRSGALHVMLGDARRYVRTTAQRYDVVIADLFHPARSGAGALYTVEHFAAIRARLRAGGVFCQWLPLHQLDLQTLRSITASFLRVYPDGAALLATNSLDTPVLGLIAHAPADAQPHLDAQGHVQGLFDRDALRARRAQLMRQDPLPARLAALQLGDEFALLGSFIAGPAALTQFAAGAALNTDDQPVVMHRAAVLTYAPNSLPRERLVALLHALQPQVGELLAHPLNARLEDGAPWDARLSAYWSARTHFIDAGMALRPTMTPTPDPQAMLAQVHESLLALVRTSADFRPAYDPLLNLAAALLRTDSAHPSSPAARAGRAEARVLLSELATANPFRFEAALRLQELDAVPR